MAGLERSQDVTGLNEDARGLLGAFMSADLNKVTNQHNTQSHAHMSDLSRPLFPGRPDGRLQAEHATVLVSDALRTSRAKLKFGSFEKFQNAFTPWFLSALHGDAEQASDYFKYYNFIVSLSFEKSWAAAEAYHWLLFARIERGEYDLRQGPEDYKSLRRIDIDYPTRSSKATGPSRPTKTYKKPTDFVFCPLHGYCAHAEASCTRTVANGGDGTKAPNFRASK